MSHGEQEVRREGRQGQVRREGRQGEGRQEGLLQVTGSASGPATRRAGGGKL